MEEVCWDPWFLSHLCHCPSFAAPLLSKEKTNKQTPACGLCPRRAAVGWQLKALDQKHLQTRQWRCWKSALTHEDSWIFRSLEMLAFGSAGQGIRRRCSFQTHVYMAWFRDKNFQVLFLWVKEGLLLARRALALLPWSFPKRIAQERDAECEYQPVHVPAVMTLSSNLSLSKHTITLHVLQQNWWFSSSCSERDTSLKKSKYFPLLYLCSQLYLPPTSEKTGEKKEYLKCKARCLRRQLPLSRCTVLLFPRWIQMVAKNPQSCCSWTVFIDIWQRMVFKGI